MQCFDRRMNIIVNIIVIIISFIIHVQDANEQLTEVDLMLAAQTQRADKAEARAQEEHEQRKQAEVANKQLKERFSMMKHKWSGAIKALQDKYE